MVAVRRVLMRVAAICRRAAGRSHSNRFSESLRHYWMRSKVEHHKPLLFCTSFLLMNQVPSPY